MEKQHKAKNKNVLNMKRWKADIFSFNLN